ncbi:MAG: hypothetical protein LBN95_08985 [Prevotellaceae bacterium]|jgi:gliding motility-associated lipoprotein GldB|nr:hypothetical protein [Prevotellaceae bacterium]
MKKYFLITLLTLFLFSCTNEKRKADLTGIDFEIKIQRFDKDFWALKTSKNQAEDLQKLYEKYPDFAPLYFNHIIYLGDDKELILKFINDTVADKLYSDVLKKFDDVEKIEKQLTNAFRRGHYFFPQLSVPQCVMCVSLLNQNVIVSDSLIALGIDKYLGADYPLYELSPENYPYLLANWRPEKVVSDYIFAWLSTEFEFDPQSERLLDEMIYKGKILYLTSLLLPKEKEETIMGYSPEQWKWCKKYERDMWQTLIQQKHLFSTDYFLHIKYLNDAPFTQPFSQESPGRAGVFIGWQIIESYMKNNPEVTPLQLMQNADAQGIFEKSGYQP